ncbi:MAG TPA: hypothetical protein ENN99_12150 [Chloroflexi bacterium]|nr:hypothetical protein [Chloroflexota bacterium]
MSLNKLFKSSNSAGLEEDARPLDRSLAAARGVEDCRQRAQALIRLLPRLAPPDRGEVQREVLAAVRECARHAHRWAPAEVVVPFEAQTAYSHMSAWSVVTSQLPQELLDIIVATVQEIEDGNERGWALAALKDVFGKSVERAQRRLGT